MSELERAEIKLSSDQWDKYIRENGVPSAVVIDVIHKCNARCAHCYEQSGPGASEITDNPMDISIAREWADVLASNPKGPPEQIWISGGEPTLFEGLPDLLGVLKEKDFYTVLVTNGERLEDKEYCEKLTSNGNLDEVAVTIRGDGPVHDLFMLPAESTIWGSVNRDKSDKDQINDVKGEVGEARRFNKTMQGIINLSKNPDLKIALNIDIQAAEDMENVVRKIGEEGGRVDYIYLQVQQEAGRAKESPEVPSNKWRRPTEGMVRGYLEQQERLLKDGVVKKVVMIDPLPQEIVKSLKLKENPIYQKIYQPVSTPAISPRGKLRGDVLRLP